MAERVPFLYRQNKSARIMGNPQPLKMFEQKKPSFEPRISNAIKIQRVTLLPWVQQFIKNLLCFAAGYVRKMFSSVEKSTCGFIFLLHNIPVAKLLCPFFGV